MTTGLDLRASNLPALAAEITAHLIETYRVSVDDPTFQLSQVMKLAEEAGEVQGAYVRLVGFSRRSGTRDEFAAELADVVITAHIVAQLCGYTLREADASAHATNTSAMADVARIAAFAGQFLGAQLGDRAWSEDLLRTTVGAAYTAAATTDVDLNAAIEAKLSVVFSRGWKN